LDDPVLAVGNALGEGIVIRDGLFTSETAEEQDGLWKWIRFSAAASPGNSGGPLLDSDGKVIGVVIGKSPNENLNYSLPIGRVLDAEHGRARFDQRELVALPYLHGTYTYSFKDGFNLPLNWPDFVKAVQALIARHNDEARTLLLNTYASTLFPKGEGSEVLLFDAEANGFRPRVIVQQADGIWSALEPPYTTTDLPGDGSVSVAAAATGAILRLVRSDSAADDAFYGDSKAFMDLALKALNLRRQVGSDQVRVTSLGAAQSDTVYVDPYGRQWQERVWAVPYMNFYLVALLLPTPDGYAGFVEYAPSAALHEALDRGRLVAGQVDISYTGTLAQWRSYLRRRALLPAGLSDVKLESAPKWTLRSRRFVSAVPSEVLSMSDKSQLSLTMGFMKDGPKVSWEIKEAWWSRDDRKIAAAGVWRRERPPGSAKLELRNKFASMRDRRSPYDGEISRETSEEYAVSRVLDVPGKKSGTVSSDLLYGLTLHLDGHPTRGDADRSLQALAAATQVIEPALGDDLPAAQAAGMAQSAAAATDKAAMVNLAQKAAAWAKSIDALAGRDIRGRQVSDDISEFASGLTSPNVQGAAEHEAWVGEQSERLESLRLYWSQYPALTRNRDMWSTFLSRNRMPADTPHEATVLAAEDALLKALRSSQPEPVWAELARQLKDAYVEERSHLVKRVDLAATNYKSRTSPCPAPAMETSGTASPKLGRMTRSLEAYYPATSRRLGEEGMVLVSLKISSTGCATSAAIVGSSGSALLDDAVLEFYETMEFIPAGTSGKAVDATVKAPIAFKLTL
jgi:TonB family protein